MVNRWTHCCSCQVVGAGVHGPQRLLEVYNHNEVGWSSQLLHTCSGHSGTHRGSSAYSMPLVVQCCYGHKLNGKALYDDLCILDFELEDILVLGVLLDIYTPNIIVPQFTIHLNAD